MLILLVLLIFTFNANSQWNLNKSIPTQVGIVVDIGSHENEIGLEIKSSYVLAFSQFQAGGRLSYVLNSYGNRLYFLDSRIFLGASILGGKTRSIIEIDPIINNLSNNSNFRNSFGFSYLWYFDNRGTSQRSGAFGLTLNNWSLYFENDVFGGQSEDRFRTAHLVSVYRKNLFRSIIGLNIWTGESRGTPWLRNKPELCKNGYKDLSGLSYGKTSSGILYGGVQYDQGILPIRAKIGMDSEEIRHVFQNRIIHDLCWLPQWAPHNTPHYPRLSKEGLPVFNSNERRKDLPFIQFSSGGMWSE